MNNARARVWALYLVFLLSGFCGLIYESIWSHYLKLILGHAAYAQAVVLIIFVGGMALGAWLTSLRSERIRNPILVYAAAEAAVAVIAFGFHFVFVKASGWAMDWLLPATCQGDGLCWAGWLLAAALILPGAVLLGSTFPLMSAGILRMGVQPGRGLSTLYFLNSGGAALGVLASGFLLIPSFGLPGTLLVSGALNLLAALAAFLVARLPGPEPVAPVHEVTSSPVGNTGRWLLLVAAVTGLSSFVYEVVWIRMLTQVLGAATHSFELMLASFILGLALGAWWIRKRIDTLARPERMLAGVQVAMGVLAVATLPLYSWCFEAMALTLKGLSRSGEAYAFFMGASAVMTMAVMLPATFCAGMTLPLLTSMLLQRGGGEREIGRAYGANTLGAILGVLATVFWLMPAAGLKWTLAAAAAIDILLGSAILWHFRSKWSGRPWALASAGVSLALVLVIPLLVALPVEKTASGVFRSGEARLSGDSRAIFSRDGRTASITVLERRDGVRTLLTNGKSDGATHPAGARLTSDDHTTVMLGALGLAHHPQARRAAVVGLGTGITSAVLLESGRIESVDTIEIEPMVIAAAQHFRPRNAAVFDDPRSRIVIDDARAHLARARLKYDLIVSEPSNPWVSGVSGLFTTQFYEGVARQLAPQGHFVQWFHVYEASPEMVGSVIKALSKTFPDYKIYAPNIADLVLVARADGGKVQLSPDLFLSAGMAGHLRRIGIDSVERLAAHEAGHHTTIQLLSGGYGAPANSDFSPYVDNRAARDRFMSARADAMFQMHVSPIPFLEFGKPVPAYLGTIDSALRTMPRKLNDLAGAWHGSRLLRGESLTPAQRTYLGHNERDYEIVRAWLWGCQPMSHQTRWDAAITVASEVNPGLSPQQAAALWTEALNGRCARQFSPEQTLWLELFRAVGSRDARATRERADQLLALSPGSQRQLEYQVLAAISARFALGEHADAKHLLDQAGAVVRAEQMELPWFRYLAFALSAPVRAP